MSDQPINNHGALASALQKLRDLPGGNALVPPANITQSISAFLRRTRAPACLPDCPCAAVLNMVKRKQRNKAEQLADADAMALLLALIWLVHKAVAGQCDKATHTCRKTLKQRLRSLRTPADLLSNLRIRYDSNTWWHDLLTAAEHDPRMGQYQQLLVSAGAASPATSSPPASAPTSATSSTASFDSATSSTASFDSDTSSTASSDSDTAANSDASSESLGCSIRPGDSDSDGGYDVDSWWSDDPFALAAAAAVDDTRYKRRADGSQSLQYDEDGINSHPTTTTQNTVEEGSSTPNTKRLRQSTRFDDDY